MFAISVSLFQITKKSFLLFCLVFFNPTFLDNHFAHLEKVTDLVEINIETFVPLPK